MTTHELIDFIAPVIISCGLTWIAYTLGWMRGYQKARKTYSDGLSEMTTTMRNALKEFEPTPDPNRNDARKLTH